MSTVTETEIEPPRVGAAGTAATILGALIAFAALAWAADLFRWMRWNFLAEQFLAAVLGMAMAVVFIARRARPGGEPSDVVPWYDWVLVAVSLCAGFYMAYAYPRFLGDFFRPTWDGLLTTWALFVLVIEGLRRCAGLPLVIVVLAFTLYALVGHLVGGSLQTREVQLNRMVFYLGVDTSGLFGLVLLIGVTVVVPFVLFGQLLSSSGGAGFFNDLSLGVMGRFRGGAAKISVLASSLFGSINGVVVSNILATGVVTIPMMKKSGFKPEQAAAIEASASNGGQLMPPVMGAVAFLMADFLQISYAQVAIAALVPSMFYYLALFIQADLEAAKHNILRVPASQIPRLVIVLTKGWLFILPFAVLIYALFSLNAQPETAAIYACIATLAIGWGVGYASHRLTLRELWNCIVRTGVSSSDIILIAAAAGFIMGILQLTGLSFALTMYLVSVGAGNILLLLFIAALLCIVLGMGMPTLGVYVLLAVLVAPALVEVGISPLAAHMFILYLGMMSFVTPPLAIAAFFAANLAKADPMKTSWYSMRFSWAAYIVPFLFVFSPTLLLQSDSWTDIAISIVTAAIGVWFVSASMIGYGLRRMPLSSRLAGGTGGFMLLIPPEVGGWAGVVNLIGLTIVIGVFVFEFVAWRARPAEVAAE